MHKTCFERQIKIHHHLKFLFIIINHKYNIIFYKKGNTDKNIDFDCIFGMSVWASEQLNKHQLFTSNFIVTYQV